MVWLLNVLFKGFYANRVRRCFKKPYIAIICLTLASLRVLGYIVTVSIAILDPAFAPNFFLSLRIVWIDSILVDVIITGSLCYYLAKGRQRSTSRR